jgi:type I restriction enzyme, R subunit
MDNTTKESVFQNDMISQFVSNGWLLGTPEKYNRERALYEEDLLGYVKEAALELKSEFKQAV